MLGNVGSFWLTDAWPWLSAWMQTTGFGGTLAVIAAGITIRVTVKKHRHDTWWEQTEWALGVALDPTSDSRQQELSIETLVNLQQMPRIGSAERNFLATVGSYLTAEQAKSAEQQELEALEMRVEQLQALRDAEMELRRLMNPLDYLDGDGHPRDKRKPEEGDDER